MQYYTEINNEKYFDFRARLIYLKQLAMPVTTPLCTEEDDKRLDVIVKLKREYVELVDEIFNKHRNYAEKQIRLDKLTEILETIGSKSVNHYATELEQLITKFEKDEGLEDFKVSMNDQLARFQNLRSVMGMEDVGEKYMCFTCLERSVDMFLDPCGHVACNECQTKFGFTCPFCRVAITPKRMFLG